MTKLSSDLSDTVGGHSKKYYHCYNYCYVNMKPLLSFGPILASYNMFFKDFQ